MMDPKAGFPYKVGYDFSGVVAAVGSAVTEFKVGDEVYGRAGDQYKGTVAEYALNLASMTAKKPKSLSFSEAASIPLAAQTALQSLDRGERELPGGLKGKIIYVPAGLSGTGSFAVQLAKNCFGAGKVITTLSTGKIPKVKELLGAGTPDQIIDYSKENIIKAVGKGTVDFMFDPIQGTLSSLPLMKKDGMIISISTLPSGTEMKKHYPEAAGWLIYMLNIMNFFYSRWVSWKGVKYEYLFQVSKTADLDRLTRWVDEGKIKPIIGRQAKLSDLEGVRNGCQEILDGKGGIGKFVIDID